MSKQGQRVLATLRSMIMSGELRPGERVAEIPVAKRLSVSRTPIRIAFSALEQEGLLIKAGARGYMVREITPLQISGAIEVRGVLEGLAARLAAERGLSAETRAELVESLEKGDVLFDKGAIGLDDVATYHDFNMRFHAAIIEASGNAAIGSALSRNDSLPFASIGSIAVDRNRLEQEFSRLHFAHMQHHIIFDALDNGQGGRAENAMREHANSALRYADLFADGDRAADHMTIITGAA